MAANDGVQFSNEFMAWNAGICRRYRKADAPEPIGGKVLSAAACKNEDVPFQLAAAGTDGGAHVRVKCSALVSEEGEIPADAWRVRFVDYVRCAEQGFVADVVGDGESRALAASVVQPIWLTLRLPKYVHRGRYTGTVEVCCDRAPAVVFRVELEVLHAQLPEGPDARFYLDLWQHPAAIARWHHVPLWSEAHWELVAAYTRLLEEAGQKPITACIIHDPWASQTFDPHESMVKWIRQPDGAFAFDFSVFDQYVELCFEQGLPGPINCYSIAMGPGSRLDCPIRYWDAQDAAYRSLECCVGDAVYGEAWGQFFEAFVPHLERMGWLDNVCIAVDEAREEKMRGMLAVVPAELSVALAGNYHESLDARLRDYSVIYPGAPAAVCARRREQGKTTTFYTCCEPAHPNTFCFSPLIESRLIAWHALAHNADGYLRWAFTSWPESPENCADYGPWPSGDAFLVYPGPKSSLRFEMLKKGIQDFEAWHIARKRSHDDPRLDEAIARANADHDGRSFDPAELEAARVLVNDILRI
ncbi:MAG TPA: DUF4091 domain-containing protein [Candidatus Hydrogenedentes bacterium]|nr:DUF4091 domain-containing protein [Candidatus Hydrogenedentota bacterium]